MLMQTDVHQMFFIEVFSESEGWVIWELTKDKVLYYRNNVTFFDKLTDVLVGGRQVHSFSKKGLICKYNSDDISPLTFAISGSNKPFTTKDALNICLAKYGSSLYWVSNKSGKLLRGVDGGYTHVLKTGDAVVKDYIITLCKTCGVEWVVYTRKLFEIHIRYELDDGYRMLNWVNPNDLPSEYAQLFISEWFSGKDTYSTKYKNVADKLQLLGMCAGYATIVASYNTGVFRVRIKKHYDTPPHDVHGVVCRLNGIPFLFKV